MSSSSSTTVPDSCRSWMSPNLNLNLNLSLSMSQSKRSSCSASSSCTTTTTASVKPHKAQQAGWEAMKGLRRQLAGGRVGLEHFRILKRVGGGDLGNVYLCQIRNPVIGDPPCLYAMKVVDREALAIRKKLGRADMEKEILGMLDHPFLPTLYAEFEASHYSCFLMEFCPGGDLFALRLRQPSRFYAAETLLALEYLHMMGIIYRDLKPENVLVRDDGHIMLSDFDLSLKCDVVPKLLKQKRPSNSIESKSSYSRWSTPSCATPIHPVLSCFTKNNKKKRVKSSPKVTATIRECANGDRIISDSSDDDDEEDNNDNDDDQAVVFDTELVAEPINARSRSFVGTHEYLAPEVISGLGHGSAVDWWTFGVFLYEMLYGKTPFKGENTKKTLMSILRQPVTFPKISLSSAKEYEEMRKAQDLICKLLMKNPRKRIGSVKGSNEIKRHDFFKGVNWALIRSVRPPLVPKELHNNKMNVSSSRVLSMPKALSKKEREEPYQLPNHFDYF
ncbi:hypothetical protein Cgig2_011560 [Carnegiea gigantea]|uniref:non-specific serine/threonine protein kinase n=1 Tax=Carnegiea gigantea TaxID=171969 RepID=A0A9Q1GIR4_9CARY|nr:hypothetical protein Cgig2_011560 [Carnegiea gigantea]